MLSRNLAVVQRRPRACPGPAPRLRLPSAPRRAADPAGQHCALRPRGLRCLVPVAAVRRL